MTYKPPFDITPTILKLSQNIFRELGALSGSKLDITPIKLRKVNSIRTIQASLSIEGNTLDLNQVTHIFEGKKVIGPQKDILEVKNALSVYKEIGKFNPLKTNDLLKAHDILMCGLTGLNGQWRNSGVAIFKGEAVAHVPPQAKMVPGLMANLFEFLAKDNDTTYLLKACIFHYELEFIHPFTDGNGRMGRLWQQILLMKEDPVFEYIPVEEIIKANQPLYYQVLSACDKAGNSTRFIEFSLEQILKALTQYRESAYPTIIDASSRLDYAHNKIGKEWFSRKDYQNLHREISSATASRDLIIGLESEALLKKGDKNQTRYSFQKK